MTKERKMSEHRKKARQAGPNRRDEADSRRSSTTDRKETEATPDTETEIGKAEQMGERFKKPA